MGIWEDEHLLSPERPHRVALPRTRVWSMPCRFRNWICQHTECGSISQLQLQLIKLRELMHETSMSIYWFTRGLKPPLCLEHSSPYSLHILSVKSDLQGGQVIRRLLSERGIQKSEPVRWFKCLMALSWESQYCHVYCRNSLSKDVGLFKAVGWGTVSSGHFLHGLCWCSPSSCSCFYVFMAD